MPHPFPKVWDNELPDGLMSDSENISFCLDDSGEWEESKKYSTIGSTVDAKGSVTAPDGYTWNIKCSSDTDPEWEKEYNNVPTGQEVDFSIHTMLGTTKVTLKVYSVNGAADAGVCGTVKLSD